MTENKNTSSNNITVSSYEEKPKTEENNTAIFINDEFGSLRSVLIDGIPYFVGKDVAEILGYGKGNNNSKALANAIIDHVDEEDRLMLNYEKCKLFFGVYQNGDPKFKINSNGLRVINESGLYSLIISSKLPKAKQFKHWVTSEVLPTIRKTGRYDFPFANNVNDKPDSYMIEDKIERAKRWIEEEEVRIALQTTITEQKPLVDFAKQVTDTTDLISMNEMAKLLKQNKLNIGRNKLFAWLREKGYLMHNNLPYQRFIDSDLFRVKEVFKNKKMYTQTYVTGKGQMHIMNKLKAENVA